LVAPPRLARGYKQRLSRGRSWFTSVRLGGRFPKLLWVAGPQSIKLSLTGLFVRPETFPLSLEYWNDY
jgi:hypothetical protein